MDTCTMWYRDANGKNVSLKPALTFAENGMEAGNTYNISLTQQKKFWISKKHQNKSMQKPSKRINIVNYCIDLLNVNWSAKQTVT